MTLSILAACGGGGGDTPPPEPALSGSVYPAMAGLVMVEYDSTGIELQRSTATDPDGRFQFVNPRRGVRLEAVSTTADTGRNALRSMQLAGATLPVLVTPVTTLTDQFIVSGQTSDRAQARVQALVQETCHASMGSHASTGTADAALRRQDAMFWAVAAYMNALQDLGFTPQVDRTWWLGKVELHRPVLGDSCAMAAAALSPTVDREVGKIISGIGTTATPASVPLEKIRLGVMTDLMKLLGKSIALSEYPQLAAPDLLGPAWREPAPAAALDLIYSNVKRWLAAQSVSTQSAGANGVAALTIDRAGDNEDYLEGGISANDPTGSAWIVNSTSEAKSLRLSINGTRLGGFGSILEDLLSVPVLEPNEPLHRRAWRYVSLRHSHNHVITGGRMLHDPMLYLRSVGTGLCDDAASVLYFLWKKLGYRARVMGLEGHVVPEIFVDDRWELYDPDLKHYFVLPTGMVANVDDIARTPQLLLSGAKYVDPSFRMSYPDLLIGIFSSTEDNKVEPWFMESEIGIAQPDIWIPPRGRLVISRNPGITITGAYADTDIPLASISIWVPPGYVGTLDLGYVLADVVGHGRISSAIGEDMVVSPEGLLPAVKRWLLTAPDLPADKITIHEVGPGGLTLVLAVNPYYFASKESLSFRVHAAALDGLSLTRPELVK